MGLDVKEVYKVYSDHVNAGIARKGVEDRFMSSMLIAIVGLAFLLVKIGLFPELTTKIGLDFLYLFSILSFLVSFVWYGKVVDWSRLLRAQRKIQIDIELGKVSKPFSVEKQYKKKEKVDFLPVMDDCMIPFVSMTFSLVVSIATVFRT